MRDAGRFAVNLLQSTQAQVAGVFASKLPEAEKLDNVPHRTVDEVPVLDDAIAWATCTVRELIAGGDHTIAIGEVRSLGLGDGEPLLWYAGAYHAIGPRSAG